MPPSSPRSVPVRGRPARRSGRGPLLIRRRTPRMSDPSAPTTLMSGRCAGGASTPGSGAVSATSRNRVVRNGRDAPRPVTATRSGSPVFGSAHRSMWPIVVSVLVGVSRTPAASIPAMRWAGGADTLRVALVRLAGRGPHLRDQAGAVAGRRVHRYRADHRGYRGEAQRDGGDHDPAPARLAPNYGHSHHLYTGARGGGHMKGSRGAYRHRGVSPAGGRVRPGHGADRPVPGHVRARLGQPVRQLRDPRRRRAAAAGGRLRTRRRLRPPGPDAPAGVPAGPRARGGTGPARGGLHGRGADADDGLPAGRGGTGTRAGRHRAVRAAEPGYARVGYRGIGDMLHIWHL